jgi:hypothetical protein
MLQSTGAMQGTHDGRTGRRIQRLATSTSGSNDGERAAAMA